jgi:2-amino-4-hydroxy-6-hydroxymethyldihydropteridine diphosphokinase
VTIVYLSLGSNQGDRIGYVQQAITQLTARPGIRLLSASSFYETEPLDCTKDAEWFVNVAVAIETQIPAESLLDICQQIETQLGRQRDPNRQNTPRTLDIDVLFYGNQMVNTDRLTIPHPRAHLRAFVLVPLLEVNPRLLHPVLNRTIEQLHNDLPTPEEVYLFGTRQLFSS